MSLERLGLNASVALVVAVAALFAVPAAPALASVCTLSDHIKSANSNTAVGFCPAGTSHDVIALTEDITLSEALPPIRGMITIEGGGHTISGDGQFRIFDVVGGTLTLKDVSLFNGKANSGGAIRLQAGASVTVTNAHFSWNTAESGGAISMQGDGDMLNVSDSSFRNNSADNGGAIMVDGSTATLSGSYFKNNTAAAAGGAIQNRRGTLSIENSTLSNNLASAGGAVHVRGGTTTLTHLTLFNNKVGSRGPGEGIHKDAGALYLRNSVIFGGEKGRVDCAGHLDQNRGNLIEDWTCNPKLGGDPLIDPIMRVSGEHWLKDGSPAVDAADPEFCLETDQVGRARPQGGGCDIGATESSSAFPPPTPAGPVCILSDHIKAANTNRAVGNCPAGTSHDVITISEDITLTSALPAIAGTITIEGGGHTISGNQKFRIFEVNGGNLIINNLTMTKGVADDGGGAIHMRNGARVTVNHSVFSHNAGGSGGAVDVSSGSNKLTVNNTHFIRNVANFSGGAIWISDGSVEITNSAFVQNIASLDGGALAIPSANSVSVVNSTFYRNAASRGGGVYGGWPRITLTHVTMLHNGKNAIRIRKDAGRFEINNSIIAGGGRPHCVGRLTENRGNLIEDGSCAPADSGDPLLGEMTGAIAHFPLLDLSPAIDAADPRFCPDFDQIGTPRPQGGGCDIGAIESTTARPAPVVVPDICPLDDQIIAANTDRAIGNCAAGNGADVIFLIRDFTLSEQLPPITSEITIEGNGYTISGNNAFRIFYVDGGALTISDVTLSEGNAVDGGAIRLQNGGRVTVSDVTFTRNRATHGGAVTTASNDVQLSVDNSSFSNNRSDANGGAIYAAGGIVNIARSDFKDNEAQYSGGALQTEDGRVRVSNSTFSNNEANHGGGIHVIGAETTLTHITMMNNVAREISGAGIYVEAGQVNLRNSIVAGSGRGDDCYGRLTENRGSLSQDGSCLTQITGDPLLADMTGALAHFPLQDASLAHGMADPAFCLAIDQLGNPRTHCDIGAIESARVEIAQAPPDVEIPSDCTLGYQIIAANTDAPAGGCPAGNGIDTIVLTQDITLSEALPAITSDLIIGGLGHTISGNKRFRIFEINGGEVTIKNMTLVDGIAPEGESGGAILLQRGELTVANITFSNNRAAWGGAVAQLAGQLNVYTNRFIDNSAENKGGGIWFDSGCHSVGDNEFARNTSSTRAPAHTYDAPYGTAMEFAANAWCGSIHGRNFIS